MCGGEGGVQHTVLTYKLILNGNGVPANCRLGKVWNGCPNKSFIFICPLKGKIPSPPPAAQLAALGINKKYTHTSLETTGLGEISKVSRQNSRKEEFPSFRNWQTPEVGAMVAASCV